MDNRIEKLSTTPEFVRKSWSCHLPLCSQLLAVSARLLHFPVLCFSSELKAQKLGLLSFSIFWFCFTVGGVCVRRSCEQERKRNVCSGPFTRGTSRASCTYKLSREISPRVPYSKLSFAPNICHQPTHHYFPLPQQPTSQLSQQNSTHHTPLPRFAPDRAHHRRHDRVSLQVLHDTRQRHAPLILAPRARWPKRDSLPHCYTLLPHLVHFPRSLIPPLSRACIVRVRQPIHSDARQDHEEPRPTRPSPDKRAVGYLALPHQKNIRHIHRSVKPLSYAADLRYSSRRTSFHPHGTRPGRKEVHTSPQGLNAHTSTPGPQFCGLG
jgi:hypothetical protein